MDKPSEYLVPKQISVFPESSLGNAGVVTLFDDGSIWVLGLDGVGRCVRPKPAPVTELVKRFDEAKYRIEVLEGEKNVLKSEIQRLKTKAGEA